MAIDARNETVFPLSQAHEYAEPIIGKQVAQSTLYRWAGNGCKGVRLETRMLGGVRFTSTEALERFFDAVTLAADGHREIPAATEPARDRQAEIDRAERELDAAGL